MLAARTLERKWTSRLGNAAAAVAVVISAVGAASGANAAPTLQANVPLAPLELADRGEMSRVPVRLTVSGGGVGLLRLGQPATEVVSFFGDLLGPPAETVTVEDPNLFGCFGGAVLTTYTWPGVVLSFAGAPGADRSFDRWVNFQFDDRAESDLLLGVNSTRGVTFADSLEIWIARHPEATPFEAESDLIGPYLSFPDGLSAEVGRDAAGPYVVQTLNAFSPLYCE